MRFKVSSRRPRVSSYNLATGEYTYLASLFCYGVVFKPGDGETLTDQYDQGKAYFEVDLLDYPAPATLPSRWYEHSGAMLAFLSNATIENQYLLIFHVNSPSTPYSSTGIAIYINGNLVRSESFTGDDYIGVLVDCPPSQHWTYAYILLTGGGTLELKEIECTSF